MLSERELMVLGLRLRGGSVKSVAGDLGLSAHTVRHYLEGIHKKLGVHSLQEAVCKLETLHCMNCDGGLFALFREQCRVWHPAGSARRFHRTPRGRVRPE